MPQKFEIAEATKQRLMTRLGRIHAYEWLDPKRTALLVVDMQNYFMAEGFLGYCPQGKAIVPNVNRLAESLRAKGGLVVWIQVEASEESKTGWSNFHETYRPENREKRFKTLSDGADGYALDPGLVTKPGDEFFTKRRYCAFTAGKGSLLDLLQSRNIESTLICGVATNVCCESTGRTSMMNGFRTIMVSDGNATNLDEDHQQTLKNFITYFGDVQSTDEVVALIEKGVTARAAAE